MNIRLILCELAQLGPTGAVMLAMAGLVYGLFGWRIVRYLVIADALFAGLLLGSAMEGAKARGFVPEYLPVMLCTVLVAAGFVWLAWRFPRWAVVCMGGVVGFLMMQVLTMCGELPPTVGILLGAVGAAGVMAMQLTLFKQSAVVVTGLHGGWLCVAALAACSARPQGFGGILLHALYNHTTLVPMFALVFSAILIAVQWADLERDTDGG